MFFGKEVLTEDDKEIMSKCHLIFGLNLSGDLNYLCDFVNSNIFLKNYEKFKKVVGPEESIFSVAYTEYNKN
jgi:hypothetical protein